MRHTLSFPPRFTAAPDPIERLDVTLRQKHMLEPVFGISDPRTSKHVNFVGGIRGTVELESSSTRANTHVPSRCSRPASRTR